MSTVLVVDDIHQLREEVAALLRYEGYQVLEAEDGEAGVQLAVQYQPDLVLCDILMPRLDGYETLAELRHHAETRTTPVIFMTVQAEATARQEGLARGAQDYITKPFAVGRLLAAITAQLGM